MFTCLLVFVSCTEDGNFNNEHIVNLDEGIDSISENKNNEENDISVLDAEKVAGLFSLENSFSKSRAKNSKPLSVKEVVVVPDLDNKPALYIVKYNPIGYVIISAT